jgi:hypothetical protein
MPVFGSKSPGDAAAWEPQAAASRLAQTAGATEFLATGTAIRRLGDEHRLPETSPKPTFTLALDS